jgi:hypothetical protein
MRRFRTFAAIAASISCFFFSAAVLEAASASVRYRIELRDGTRIDTRGYPVARGSVWTFHETNGLLTGVPREMVLRIVREDEGIAPVASVAAREAAAPVETVVEEAPAPLEPGELIELPSTGDGPGAEPPSATAATGVAPVGPPVNGYGGLPNPYYGNSIYGTGNAYPPGGPVGPDGMGRVLSTTDLSRALSATTPAGSVASNGFPTLTTSSPTVIGPDGTPTLGSGASPQLVIGPDGTPILAGNGGATPSPVIGPNGTPALTPASPAPMIGPNGTPTLAPAGQAGSAALAIGPNGTPILAPPGQPGSAFPTIGSNGTPAARIAAPAAAAAGGHR